MPIRLLVVAALLAGCARVPPAPPKPLGPPPEVEVLTDPQQLKDAVAAEAGRTVVLNIWASYCPVCRQELPELARFAADYQSRGVTVITLSLDGPESLQGKMHPMLVQTPVVGQAFVMARHEASAKKAEIDPEWTDGTPATIVYAPDGSRAAYHLGGLTYKQFGELVKDHLPG